MKTITTAGAPRDLGLDQGEVLAAAIQDELRFGPSAQCENFFSRHWLRSSRERKVMRDLARYFPHTAERIAGLARGAGLSRSRLTAILVDELESFQPGFVSVAAGFAFGITPEKSEGIPWLGKTIEMGCRWSRSLILRQSLPDNGYRSIEVTTPAHAGSIAGVNEKGLAMVVSSVPVENALGGRYSAPAMLLGQDVLLRFDSVEKALDWCLIRPVGGQLSMVLSDARGTVLGLEIRGSNRSVRVPQSGWVEGVPEGARNDALTRAVSQLKDFKAGSLWELMGTHATEGELLETAVCRHEAWFSTQASILVDPVHREISWVEGPPCQASSPHSFSLSV